MSFTPSPQQAGFFNWIQTEIGSAVLEAVAGAGKTTTLIHALTLMSGEVFFGAFNKKIADEIKARAPNRDGLTISTMHACGLAAWKRVAKFPRVEADKVRDIYREVLCHSNPSYSFFTAIVSKLVGLAKQAGLGIDGFPSIDDEQAWIDIVDHYDIETFDEYSGVDNTALIIRLSQRTLKISNERCTKIIDFDDMIYAPLVFNVQLPQYDWVLIDEAQDTNATRRLLALRMLKPQGRLVAVGDRHQAIYGFTGADAKALDLIGDAVNATRLPLTTTFRCPKSVVEYAQQWVSHIQAADTAPDGIVRHLPFEQVQTAVKPGDAILCRYNAPLVTMVYRFIADGVPAKIEGREIGNGIKVLARRWKVKSFAALLDRLDTYLERETTKLRAKEQETKAVAIEDKVTCLRVIIDRVQKKNPNSNTPVDDICFAIDELFGDTDNTKDVVLLSSIHKSKGREFNHVVWLQTKDNGRARKEWELEQEINLKYVAATRAKKILTLTDWQQ